MFKQITKIVLFILIFVLTVALVSDIFIPKSSGRADWNQYAVEQGIYNEPSDSLDVLVLGSSRAAVGFSPMYLWKEYGYTSYCLGTRSQQPIISELFLKDTYEKQHYKVVILEVTQMFRSAGYDDLQEYYKDNEAVLMESLSALPFSYRKLETIFEIQKNSNISLTELMFPLSRFHGRWEKDLSRKDFTSPEEIENKKFLHGQEYITSTFAIDGSPSIIAAGREKSGDLVDYDKHLIDIIEFCKEKDITLILTHMPSQKKWSVDKNTTIHSIAEQYDVPFVDYMEESLWNSANMDLTTDYFDASHFNCRGAEKVTRLYGDLLAESGLLSDKRSNPAYAQWNEDIDAYDSVLSDSLLTATSFPSDFFGKLRSEDKLILISVDAEDYTSVMDDDMQAWLTELGLDGSGKGLVPNGAKVYAACIDQNQILCDTVSKSSSIQKKLFSNGRHISLSAQHNSAGYTAFTVDSMENKSYPDKGIHIFVYNTFLEKPIDSVTMYKNSEGKWVFIRTQTWQ